ncbi:hypothetical protein Scep_002234 [Stephania cephalantha]|uniref:Retrotransposon gag domain-containing protein n=1 Tax=Stephania cephalantha TaxID=152367 RepID=A0AAP0LAU5_9MAGN
MADSRDAKDTGASGSQPSTVSVDDFQRLSDQMTAQERQIAKFIAYMSAQMTALVSTAPVTTATTTAPPSTETPTAPATTTTAEARAPVPPAEPAAPRPLALPVVTVPTIEAVVDTPTPSISEITGLSRDAKLVKEFIKLRPAYFSGERDHDKIKKWILSQEKLHLLLGIEDKLQPVLSYYTLDKGADVWWRTTMASRGSFTSWAYFKVEFYKQYFSASMLQRLKKKFMSLRQAEEETVMMYRDRYGYMRQFAGDLVKNDADDAFYFGDGLRPNIARHVIGTGARTLQEIYERALVQKTYELGREEERAAEGYDQGSDYDRRRRGKGQRRGDRGPQRGGAPVAPISAMPYTPPLHPHRHMAELPYHLPPDRHCQFHRHRDSSSCKVAKTEVETRMDHDRDSDNYRDKRNRPGSVVRSLAGDVVRWDTCLGSAHSRQHIPHSRAERVHMVAQPDAGATRSLIEEPSTSRTGKEKIGDYP